MRHLGNSAASATVTGQSHGMNVDVPSITAIQSHLPVHIAATVWHKGGWFVRGSTAHEVHPANPHLLWCTKSHHWVHRDHLGDQRTCSACQEKQQLWNARGCQIRNEIQNQMWVLNTIMWYTAKKASSWYLNTHHDDCQLTVEDIWDLINQGDANSLANCVSHAGEKLPGSKPFWQKAQKDIISMIRSPECGTPHVFFTASSADI